MHGVMEVQASAPGKVILSGEHAVVHGFAAVAASLGLYTRCSVKLSTYPDSDESICLHLSDLNLHLRWLLRDIQEVAGLLSPDILSPPSASNNIIAKFQDLVDRRPLPEAKVGVAAGITAFLYLYTCIIGMQPATVTITSELPLGSGLGSSASYCVSLAAAFLALAKKLGPGCCKEDNTSVKLEEEHLKLINEWAFEGEKIIHGRPSGIDNTVSTFGYFVKFKGGDLARIHESIPLKMLITNTKVGRNTKALVAGVGERALRHPKAMTAVFEATDAIVEEVVSILQSVTKGTARSEDEAKLEELVEMNQGLLQCMGVSHSSIDSICKITSKYQLRSKLTGAGGGGCVLTIIPELMTSKTVDKVKKELQEQGFDCFEAIIGCQGVQLHAVES